MNRLIRQLRSTAENSIITADTKHDEKAPAPFTDTNMYALINQATRHKFFESFAAGHWRAGRPVSG